jgi:hypothetical protein
MSLEWARVRVLRNEVRLRELVKSSDRKGWVDFTVTYPARVTIGVAPEGANRLASIEGRGRMAAESVQS